MKYVVRNVSKLKENEIQKTETRVKALILNEENNLLLGYSYNMYQFPGGHHEDGENIIDTLIREIKEETGIDLIASTSPFYKYERYLKKGDKKEKQEIYYYVLYTNETPKIECTNYTEEEKIGKFCLEYVPLSSAKKIIFENAKRHSNAWTVAKEMINAINIYQNEYKNGNII